MPSYFPGCKSEGTGRDCDIATRAVFGAFGIPLSDLPDWNCCGSTPLRSVSEDAFHALNARNLALAEAAGQELAVSCAICYNALKRTQYEMASSPERRAAIERMAGAPVHGVAKVRHVMEILAGYADTIQSKMTRMLSGLKVACYYGCLLTRPAAAMRSDDPENPQIMDRLVAALGAKPTDWAAKTDCCGAYLSVMRPGPCRAMRGRILRAAHESEANAIAVACPVCHCNLDIGQSEAWQEQGLNVSMPVFHVTELVGLALGLPEAEKAVKMHMTPVEQVIALRGA